MAPPTLIQPNTALVVLTSVFLATLAGVVLFTHKRVSIRWHSLLLLCSVYATSLLSMQLGVLGNPSLETIVGMNNLLVLCFIPAIVINVTIIAIKRRGINALLAVFGILLFISLILWARDVFPNGSPTMELHPLYHAAMVTALSVYAIVGVFLLRFPVLVWRELTRRDLIGLRSARKSETTKVHKRPHYWAAVTLAVGLSLITCMFGQALGYVLVINSGPDKLFGLEPSSFRLIVGLLALLEVPFFSGLIAFLVTGVDWSSGFLNAEAKERSRKWPRLSLLHFERIRTVVVVVVFGAACCTCCLNAFIVFVWAALNEDARVETMVDCPASASVGAEFPVTMRIHSAYSIKQLEVFVPEETLAAFELVSVAPSSSSQEESFGGIQLAIGKLDAEGTKTVRIVLRPHKVGVHKIALRVWADFPWGHSIEEQILVQPAR